MKSQLKKMYDENNKLEIDTFIEKKFIDIIMAVNRGETNCYIEIEEKLLNKINLIKKEFEDIFSDSKIFIQNEKIIIIDWS